MSGKFIVIEGLEGAGKSTAVSYVLDCFISAWYYSDRDKREPGGAPLAEKMRSIVKEVHDELRLFRLNCC